MAVATIPHLGVGQRITPQEQLDQLHDDMAKFIEEGASEYLGSEINHTIAEYAADPNWTNWHKALRRIGALPERIPALPRNIVQILTSQCPIRSDERKPDGTTYRVGDTHSLYLIPPDSLNELLPRMYAYGKKIYAEDKNPFRFYFLAPNAFRDVRSNDYEWILISNDALKDSTNQPYERQARMVADLSREAFANYEVPSLKDAAMAIFLHKVATGEDIYPAKAMHWYFTRVRETSGNRHLGVGAFCSDGLVVDSRFGGHPFAAEEYVGVAPLRRF